MPFPGLTRLSASQLLTDVIWNELMDLLEAKFSGSVGQNDLQWPLLVGGDIDFGQVYGILGLRKLWGIVNAAEYASLDAAVSAAEAGSNGNGNGGMVMIPPDTTIIANNVSIDASNVMIVGCGPSSVIKITAASTNPLFTTAATGLSGIVFANLTLDGTGGGAGCVGVRLRSITRAQMRNVYMTGFTGDFISCTNDGVAGNSCVDVTLHNVLCSGGSDSHFFADDISGLYVSRFTSKTATGNAFEIVPVSSSHLAQDISISDSKFSSGAAKAVRIIGTGGTAIDAHSRIKIANCSVVGMTGLPFELGNTSTILKDVTLETCTAVGAAGDAVRIAASAGVISGNHLRGAGSDGIDITNSIDLWVQGNNCQDAVAYGIDATSTTDCTVIGNNLRDAGTDGINRTTSTNLHAYENVGDDAPTIGSTFSDGTARTISGSATGDFGFTYTIPAGSLKTGNCLDITFLGVAQSGGTSGAVGVRLNATNVYSWNVVTTTDNYITIQIRADQGGTTHIMAMRVTEDRTPGDESVEIDNNSSSIDWSINQVLTFNCTGHGGAGDITVDHVLVKLYGSK